MGRADFLNPDNEEKLLFAKICDLCERAEKGRPSFSRFLNLREQEIAKAALSSYSVESLFYGGFEGAEKKMLGIFPDSMDAEKDYFPMELLTLEFPKIAEISHRDVLGSLMSLGIERNCVGEIFLNKNEASFAVLENLTDTVLREIKTIGRYPVKIKPYEGDGIILRNTEDKTAVLSSLRLDCVISAVTGKSRSVSSSLIKKVPVLINDKRWEKLDEPVPLGSVITVRGFGKYKLSEESTRTSKDKIRLVIHKYI